MLVQQWCNGAGGSSRAWGKAGKMPQAGQRCFESAQLACYQKGQQFMSHEVCTDQD